MSKAFRSVRAGFAKSEARAMKARHRKQLEDIQCKAKVSRYKAAKSANRPRNP